MAKIELYKALDMSLLLAWDGDVTIADSSHIQVTDGYRTQNYYGVFAYDSDGYLIDGFATSTTSLENGQIVFKASEFNVNATTLESYVDSDAQAALQYVLSGDDTILGSSGNDKLIGYGGRDTIDGGGLDVAYYDQSRNNFTVTGDGTTFHVTNFAGFSDTLVNIERVSFSDGTVLATDVEFGENTGSAYRLYKAAFDRTADKAGLSYWVAELDSGRSIQQIAQGFVDSAEFKQLNPALDQHSIINSYYQNVLNRDADQAGYDYWSQQMSNGMKPNEVLVSFSESQENISNTAAEIQSGIWLI